MNFQQEANSITFGSITVLKRTITTNVNCVFKFKVPLSFPATKDDSSVPLSTSANVLISPRIAKLDETFENISSDIDPPKVEENASKSWASLLKSDDKIPSKFTLKAEVVKKSENG